MSQPYNEDEICGPYEVAAAAINAYEDVAEAIGMVDYPEGQGGKHVATPAELVRYVKELQQSRDRYQDERDEAREVAYALAAYATHCDEPQTQNESRAMLAALAYPEVNP